MVVPGVLADGDQRVGPAQEPAEEAEPAPPGKARELRSADDVVRCDDVRHLAPGIGQHDLEPRGEAVGMNQFITVVLEQAPHGAAERAILAGNRRLHELHGLP